MLLVLIPIVWVALLTLFAAICRVAADGDAQHALRHDREPASIGMRLTFMPATNSRPAQARRGTRRRPALKRTTRIRRPVHIHRAR
jgi:hypothetical protein